MREKTVAARSIKTTDYSPSDISQRKDNSGGEHECYSFYLIRVEVGVHKSANDASSGICMT